MRRHLLIGRVQIGIVAAGLGHAGLGVGVIYSAVNRQNSESAHGNCEVTFLFFLSWSLGNRWRVSCLAMATRGQKPLVCTYGMRRAVYLRGCSYVTTCQLWTCLRGLWGNFHRSLDPVGMAGGQGSPRQVRLVGWIDCLAGRTSDDVFAEGLTFSARIKTRAGEPDENSAFPYFYKDPLANWAR